MENRPREQAPSPRDFHRRRAPSGLIARSVPPPRAQQAASRPENPRPNQESTHSGARPRDEGPRRAATTAAAHLLG
ncbi:hypothetical protein ACFPM0_14420 [Pseudonocardia sulfidoxydans]|uniref:hypothetical protein n=1 Tax=Pseudonocardia sulfidoxydans TaxID=54011 RepID=UPI003606BB36